MPIRARRTPILAFVALLVTQTFILTAQQPGRAGSARGAQIRDLNNQLLNVYARLRNLPPDSSLTDLRREASSVIATRAAALEALIQESPGEALSFAFSADLLSGLAAAFPDSASELESVNTFDGSIEVTIEDDRTMSSHRTVHRMSLPGIGNVSVHFSDEALPELQSGDRVRFRGVRVRSEIAADGATITGGTEGAPVMCPTLGAQRSIVLLVNMPGTTPPNISTSSVHDIFFASSGRSLNGFWQENSYGQAWAEGDVRGWYTLDANYSCEDYPLIRDAAVRAADADVDFRQYDRVFVIISGISGGCAWAGIANVGCGSTIQSAEGTFLMSGAWMMSDYFFSREQGVRLAIHEGGHGLGLHHASSRSFGSEPLGPPDVNGTLDEYGDVLSTMGLWNFGHYAAPHKVQLGWMRDYATVSTSGTFALPPTEQASNMEALKIQRGTDNTKFLWVEFRRTTGLYDSQFAPETFDGGLIHYEDSTTGFRSHLLDFTRSTTSFSDATLKGSWTDPYTNLSISTDTTSSSVLGVNVAYGPVPCIQAAPSVALSPPNPSVYPGENATYTVTVTNNDSPACSLRTFNLGSTEPASWPTAFSEPVISIAPGMSSSVAMVKTVPSGTVTATYLVDTIATGSGGAVTGTANVTVMPLPLCAPSPPTVTLSPSDSSGYAGQNLLYTVAVLNRDSSVCAVRTFNLSSLLPSSWPTAFTSNTLTIGAGLTSTATMTKTIPSAAAAGTYSVNAIAASGADSAQGTASATVKPPVLAITVTVPSSSVKTNSTVTIAAVVTLGPNPASGATVNFTLQTPSAVVAKRVVSDSSGKALWNYKVGPKAPTGSYTVSAQATWGSQTANSAPATFTVK